MTQYAGNPVYPKDFTKLDSSSNGANPATWNVPLEALGDRTTYLQRTLATRIAAFEHPINHTPLNTTPITGRPGYSKKRQAWWVVRPQEAHSSNTHFGNYRIRYSSLDPGGTYAVAFINDPANPRYGNGYFLPLASTALRATYTDSTDTFASSSADLPSNGWSGIQHIAQNDLWLIWHTGKLYTSPTSGTPTWTSRALPGGTMFPTPPVTDGSTTIVQGKTKGLYSSTSLTTWTELTTAFGSTSITGLVYDAFRSRFLVWVTNGTTSETWASDDSGASWISLATSIPLGSVSEIHSIGPTLVGWHLTGVTSNDHNELVYSIDGGITWGRAPTRAYALYNANPVMASNGVEAMAVRLAEDYRGISFSGALAPVTF